jgi:hypothetical protein
MKRYILILILALPVFAQAQTSNMARIIAREMLRVGSDTSKYFTSTTQSVTAASTNREVPTAKAVWDMSVKERMSFGTSAPADTNLTWAKTNSAPWKLDSVFTYEFGSWHIAGFYDRISGVFSEKPPLFVVATGQSNMLGIDGGGDTTTDRRLVAWDTTAHVWKVANLGVNPFNSTGANSLAFSFGKEVARRENRIVRLIVMAKSSQAISAWFGSSTTSIAYNTNLNVLQSGMPRCDVILWHQGESNYDGAGGCNNNTCYTDSLYAIIRQFRGYSWADENTVFIAGGLFDGVGATQQDRNTALRGLNSDTISTTGYAYATGLDDSGDAVHFSGPALVTLGAERYYNVWRSLPGLYNHTAGSGGGGLTLPTGTHDGQILTWNGSAWEEYSGSAHGNGLYWDSTNGWQEYGLTASNLFFASSGTPSTLAKPAMRAIVAADLPAIDLTSGVTGTLPAANGGTGNSSYTTGDILYASGATTLSKLADVVTGNALISGGVGVAPSYGKIGLTTHVSGTLPVTSGGTGLTTAAQGDIVYGSASNTLSLLSKSTTATRYLSNTGTSNNPAWAQVNMADGVTGTLPVANGGTGLTTLSANRIPYGNGTSAFQSSGNLVFDGSTLSITGKNSMNIAGTYTSSQNFFNVSGTVTSTANSLSHNVFNFAPTFYNDGTVTSQTYAGMRFVQTTSTPTLGLSYNMVMQNVNTSANVSQLYGINSRLDENTTTGNLTVRTRTTDRFQCYKTSNGFDSHTGTGLQVDLNENSSTGRWNNGNGLLIGASNAITLRGINQSVVHTKGTGNTQYGFDMANNVSGSGVIVSNAYGIRLSSTASSSGVITNYYGIYQNSIPTGGTLTYFLYNGNNARSYTNGSFAIGTDATTSKLLVRGTGTTSSTYSGIFEKSDGTDVLVVRDDGKVAIANDGFNEALNVNGQVRADAVDIRSWETTDNTNDGELHYEDGDGETAYLTIGAGERRFPILPHMIQLQAIDYNVDWTTGRTKAFWTVPARFNGWKVSKVYVSVSSIGSVTGNVVEIEKGGVGITTQTISSASHTITIDNSIATDDIFTFDITSIGATASKGLFVEIELRHN